MEAHCPEVSQGSEQRSWQWLGTAAEAARFLQILCNFSAFSNVIFKGKFHFWLCMDKILWHLSFVGKDIYKTEQTSSLIVAGVSFLLVSLNGPGFPHI